MTRIDRERLTVKKMIEIYCRHKEGNEKLCPQCADLIRYAGERLNKCPFGDRKASCRRCSIHCYRQDMKIRIREVMRYSGRG